MNRKTKMKQVCPKYKMLSLDEVKQYSCKIYITQQSHKVKD